MVEQTLTEQETEAIRFLREQAKDLLSRSYDTDYNLLRWAQGYSFNMEEALHHLIRHLKFRQFYDLDNIDKLKEDKILKQYFPLGLVGDTGRNNQLLVVECAGRIDLHGILQTVQLNVFLSQRFRFQEAMLNEINRMEEANNKQCSVIYILDLEGLKFDSHLLNIVTGPYRILWTLVYTNYPEWLDKQIIVNAPGYVLALWNAVKPLLPERTRGKVRIVSSTEDSIKELRKLCDMEKVPKHWGGELIDANGDPMCRDRLTIPTEKIPKDLYWQPDEKAPHHRELDSINLGAGSSEVITIRLKPCDRKAYLNLNRYAEKTYSMAVYHTADENAIDQKLDEMREWIPIFDYPAMPTVDHLKVPSLGAGVYKFRFGNEAAWFRSVTVYYRIRFTDEQGQPIPVEVIS